MHSWQQNIWYPKGINKAISELHSILNVEDLLGHNNIAKGSHVQVGGVPFILLLTLPYINLT